MLAFGSLRCDDEPSCEEIAHEAASAMAQAGVGVDRTCTVDGDCAIQDFEPDCLGGCGSPRAVASSAQSQLKSQWGSLEEQYCAPLRAPRCAAFVASNIDPCTAMDPLAAVCLNGKCELCGGDKCSLQDEMQICTRAGGELSDCYSLQPRR
jgi:hypothetical protein